MNTQTRSRNRMVDYRAQSELRSSETFPTLTNALRMMTIPCEQRTPRGTPPSKWLKRKIVKAQNSGPLWEAIIAILFFRKSRGEPVTALQAPLYRAAASLEDAPDGDRLQLIRDDTAAENATRDALITYQADPTPANWSRLQELEAVELATSSRIVRFEGGAR